MRKMRVEELAAESGTSVHSIRSYQTRGLIPPPRREGRLAIYSDRHLHRLRTIAQLRGSGLTLQAIHRVLEHGEHLEAQQSSPAPTEQLTLEEVADQAGVPPTMVRSLEASGLVRPAMVAGERRYTSADSQAVRMILTLLGPGLPVEHLVAAARPELAALDDLAAAAVELFRDYGRAPILEAGFGRRKEAERVLGALRLVSHAASWLVGYHLRRRILSEAEQLLSQQGTPSEQAALAREALRSIEW